MHIDMSYSYYRKQWCWAALQKSCFLVDFQQSGCY